jgi:GMP synthase-like glutamine amidotransferase
MHSFKIAILDLYEGEANEGMRCIHQLIEEFRVETSLPIYLKVFDVRLKKEMPDLSFDAYISSGGPGSPLTSEGSLWEEKYFNLMDDILAYNSNHPFQRKNVFLICHSFQIFCRYYGYAQVSKRKSTSFGIMPIHKTKAGQHEPFFVGLNDPIYAVDSRDYQILRPNEVKIWSGGGHILCIEKDRPFIPLARAVMAIRFNEAFIGVQFHPETDAAGMHKYLLRDDKKKIIVEKYGDKKYHQMLSMVNEPDKINLTYKTILPSFLRNALLTYLRHDTVRSQPVQ